MLLELLKQHHFFEKQNTIASQVKSLGIELWVVVPKGGTLLNQKRLHILYSCLNPKQDTRLAERTLLGIFKENLGSCELELHGKNALEESLVIMPWQAHIVHAHLQSVIPFQSLSSELSVEEQIKPLEIPAIERIQARIEEDFKAADIYLAGLEKEPPVDSSKLLENVDGTSFSPKRRKGSDSSPSVSPVPEASPGEEQRVVKEMEKASLDSSQSP